MSTKTTTKVAHYYVQKQRRAEFIENWRGNRRTVVALEDVEIVWRTFYTCLFAGRRQG